MKTAKMLRKEFNDLTGKGTEVPGFIGEPIVFTQSYVRWLEKRLIDAYEKTSNMEELVKAQKEYIHITDNQLWLAKPSKYYDKYCQLRKRITELNNNLK